MTKLSVSVDDDLALRVATLANEAADGNLSLLTALALRRILDVPLQDLSCLLALQRVDRRAPTRDAWMKAFWQVLVTFMDRPELEAIKNPYAMRQFEGVFAILLLNHVDRYDDENDPFLPHIASLPAVAGSPPPYQWTFSRASSPVVAAEAVASKLREYIAVCRESKGVECIG